MQLSEITKRYYDGVLAAKDKRERALKDVETQYDTDIMNLFYEALRAAHGEE